MQRTSKAPLSVLFLASLLPTAATAWQTSFQWDWRRAEELTSKESLRRAKLTKAERAAISRAIANQIRPDMSDWRIESEEQLENFALDARIKMVDLNGDGTPEVIVQGMGEDVCSPTGNCPCWVFQKTNLSYKLLLYNESVQSFTIERSRTNGFKDIVLATHDSGTESGLTLYRYANGAYHDVACYDASWTVLEDDNIRELKEPRITPCGQR